MTNAGSPPRFRDLLLYPNAFFECISKENISLLRPFLIVMAGALAYVVVILIFFVWHRSGWSLAVFGPISFAGAHILSLARTAFLAPFVLWMIAAVIFYGICHACKGTGSFSMTLQNTGFGLLPWTISAVIPLAAYLQNFFTYRGGPVSGGYSGIWMMPPGLSLLPLILILIWSGFLWVPAIQHTHGFTRQKAIAIVWIPVLISVLLFLPCIAWYL